VIKQACGRDKKKIKDANGGKEAHFFNERARPASLRITFYNCIHSSSQTEGPAAVSCSIYERAAAELRERKKVEHRSIRISKL
jgi:hypothetical protein